VLRPSDYFQRMQPERCEGGVYGSAASVSLPPTESASWGNLKISKLSIYGGVINLPTTLAGIHIEDALRGAGPSRNFFSRSNASALECLIWRFASGPWCIKIAVKVISSPHKIFLSKLDAKRPRCIPTQSVGTREKKCLLKIDLSNKKFSGRSI
jgi:hypothetical protein